MKYNLSNKGIYFDFGWYSILILSLNKSRGGVFFLLNGQHLLSMMSFMLWTVVLYIFEKLVSTGVFGFVYSLVLADF